MSVSLESAMKLLRMDYKGQIHTAYSDSFNTVRILHKLFCTESLSFEFDYINPINSNEKNEKIKCKTPEVNYNCAFASFMSPELLAQFEWNGDEELNEAIYEDFGVEEESEVIDDSPLAGLINDEEINNLCAKYKIRSNKWLKLANEVMGTGERLVE